MTSKTSPQRSPALPANAAPLAAAPSSAAKGSENRGEPPIYRLFFILGVLLIAVGTMSCIVGLVALMFGDSKMLPLAICGTLAAAAGGTLHLLRNLGMDMGW